MIEKIDKPEAPPPYRVQATTETRGGKQQHKGQEERKEEDEYSASAGVKGWQKYHTEAEDRQSVKLRKKDIAGLFFNQVVLQKGLVVIDTNLQLINGNILKNVHLFSTKIDMYWKMKKLKQGEKVPVDEIITEEYVEASVLQKQKTVKTVPAKRHEGEGLRIREPKRKKTWYLWPLIDKNTGRPNWAAIVIYSVIIISVFITLMMIL